MTIDHHRTVDEPTAPDAGQVQQMLDATRASVLELIERTDVHPASVRLTVGAISLEMDWAQATPVAAGPVVPAAPVPGHVPPAEPVVTGPATDASALPVTAPAVGVFYRAPEPGAAPFVEVGDTVVPGQKIGLIEAMKLLIPVESDRSGTIAEIVGENGAAVEYGQPLLTLTPDGQG